MDSFKIEFFQSLAGKNLLELNESECEKEIFEYLNSIYESENLNTLKEYSLKLNDIKSNYFFLVTIKKQTIEIYI